MSDGGVLFISWFNQELSFSTNTVLSHVSSMSLPSDLTSSAMINLLQIDKCYDKHTLI